MYSCQSLTIATCYQHVRNVMPLRRSLRYRSMSAKVIYYQFFFKMAEPAVRLAAMRRRSRTREISAEHKNNKRAPRGETERQIV